MKKFLFLILALFSGCQNFDGGQVTPLAIEKNHEFSLKEIRIYESEDDVDVKVLKRFSAKDIAIARYCENFVSNLLKTNYNVDYNNFYWVEGLPENYSAITLMDGDRFVLVQPSLLPKDKTPFPIYAFGVTILHEWMHYHYSMHHPQVQNTVDIPADRAYRQWYVEQFRTD